MNQINLIGRITKDLELKTNVNQNKYVYFTLAVSEYNDGKEFTNFIPCIAWNNRAENMCQFLHKGSQIGITGKLNVNTKKLENDKYETIINVVASQVQFLDSKKNENGSNEWKDPSKPKYQNNEQTASIEDDDSILWD